MGNNLRKNWILKFLFINRELLDFVFLWNVWNHQYFIYIFTNCDVQNNVPVFGLDQYWSFTVDSG